MAKTSKRKLTPCEEHGHYCPNCDNSFPFEEPAAELLSRFIDLLDAGILVRNTRFDNEPGWAIKQLPLVMTLQAAKVIADQWKADHPKEGHENG